MFLFQRKNSSHGLIEYQFFVINQFYHTISDNKTSEIDFTRKYIQIHESITDAIHFQDCFSKQIRVDWQHWCIYTYIQTPTCRYLSRNRRVNVKVLCVFTICYRDIANFDITFSLSLSFPPSPLFNHPTITLFPFQLNSILSL